MHVKWVDTHTHLDRYEPDERAAILARAGEAGVAIISVGVDVESSRAAVELDGIAGTAIGIHPLHAATAHTSELMELLTGSAGVIAVGECGFDAAGPPFEVQAAAFWAQARCARALDFPLVLHIDGEGAFDALCEHSAAIDGLTVVRHYFTGDATQATWHAERDHYLSFGNPLRRDPALREVAFSYPADLVLIETDSYPLPARRTEPRDVVRVGETLALVRGWTFPEASERLLRNTAAAFPRLAPNA